MALLLRRHSSQVDQRQRLAAGSAELLTKNVEYADATKDARFLTSPPHKNLPNTVVLRPNQRGAGSDQVIRSARPQNLELGR